MIVKVFSAAVTFPAPNGYWRGNIILRIRKKLKLKRTLEAKIRSGSRSGTRRRRSRN